MAHLRTITGPMFSHKSAAVLKYIRVAVDLGKSIVVAKPSLDTRKSRDIFHQLAELDWSKNYPHLTTGFINSLDDLRELMDRTDPHQYPALLAIDEAQLFYPGDWLFDFIMTELLEKNVKIDVIISGLATDFQKRPFNQVPNFMAIANHNLALTTKCFKCGGVANLTYRKPGLSKEVILIGDLKEYEARCWACHDTPYK